MECLARLLLRVHRYPEGGAAYRQALLRRRKGLRGWIAESAAMQSPRHTRVQVHYHGEPGVHLEPVAAVVRVQLKMPRRYPGAETHLPWRGPPSGCARPPDADRDHGGVRGAGGRVARVQHLPVLHGGYSDRLRLGGVGPLERLLGKLRRRRRKGAVPHDQNATEVWWKGVRG